MAAMGIYFRINGKEMIYIVRFYFMYSNLVHVNPKAADKS